MPKKRHIAILIHYDVERPGRITEAIERAGLHYQIYELYAGATCCSSDDITGLVIMGGPMSVHEHSEHPFLDEEHRLIRQVIDEDKPVLGICLGSQLIASSLGAEIRRGSQLELGWHEVKLTKHAKSDPLFAAVPNAFTPLHWHGDIFDLPPDAVPLASSDITEHQAFRFGEKTYGLLFHLEATPRQVSDMATCFPEDVRTAGLTPKDISEKTNDFDMKISDLADAFFDRWCQLIVRETQPAPSL